MRAITAVAFILALASQQQRPSDRAIKSSVDLVRVDVIAVDGRGQPIPDLAIEDFELRVDGKRRAIATAQFVSVAPETVGPPPASVHYSSNRGTAGGRLIMVVIDRTSITTGTAKSALVAASAFVESLNDADRVALATIPDGPQVPFTADHALVKRLLLGIDGTAAQSFGSRNLGIADALAFERRDDLAMQTITERECGVANLGSNVRGGSPEVMICQGEVKSEALLVAAEARARARQSIAGLRALLESFPPSQTPKILVFLSEGLAIQGEAAALSWLDGKAAEAHVTIYPLRLESSRSDASQKRPPVNVAADRTLQEHGLAALAQATGGDLFRIISNSDFAFRRLSAELSGYYLLGFEPEARERDGMAHVIDVRVRRRGVTVRSRRQFAIPITAAATTDQEIVAALRDPLPAADIPLKLATYSFRDRRHDRMRLFLAAEIDRSPEGGDELVVGYVVVDFEGRLVSSRMDAALPVTAAGPRSQRYFSNVDLEPGKYTVKLAVVDGAGRRGSVERVAAVGMVEAGPVRATELLLGDGPDPAWALPLAPAVSGEIRGASLHGYIELFAQTPTTFADISVTLEIVQADSSAAPVRVPMQLVPAEDNPQCRVAMARADVGRLPPGDYIARAVIAAGLDAVGEVSRPIRLAPAKAGQ